MPRIPLNLVLLKGSTVKGYDIAGFERHHPVQTRANREALERMFLDGRLTPGPKIPLCILGHQVTRIYAYPPPFPIGARTSIGVYSYLGNVHFGATADHSSVPDVDAISTGMQRGFDRLLQQIPQP